MMSLGGDAAGRFMLDIQRRAAENAQLEPDRIAEIEAAERQRAQEQLADRRRRMRDASGIPPRFATAKLEQIEINAGNEHAVHAAARVVASDFQESLALYGNEPGAAVGNGKTLIAAAILNAAIDACVPAKFLRASSMFDALHQASKYQSDGDVIEILQELATVRVLVIDDLGRESLTQRTIPWLHDLFDRRLCELRGLVVTSNLDLLQLHEHYAEICEARSEPRSTADGIVDRLRGMIPKERWVKVTGRSQRGRS